MKIKKCPQCHNRIPVINGRALCKKCGIMLIEKIGGSNGIGTGAPGDKCGDAERPAEVLQNADNKAEEHLAQENKESGQKGNI